MNVLIVDDDAYVLQGLKHGLDWGSLDINNVFTAPNVKKSKQIIESQSVQILICDIEMPKENGFDLLEWLKLKNIEMNVIMLTSHAEFKYAAQAIKYNCEAYSLKPIDFSELSELVSNAVSNAKKRLSLNDHEIFQEYWHKSENKRKKNS
jgi:two-component system response regulator YesN